MVPRSPWRTRSADRSPIARQARRHRLVLADFVGYSRRFAYPDARGTQHLSAFVASKLDTESRQDGAMSAPTTACCMASMRAPAAKGEEKLAFIPAAVFRNLHELTKPNYTHHSSSSTARRPWATSSSAAPGTPCWSAASTRAARASTRSTSRSRRPSPRRTPTTSYLWEFTNRRSDLGLHLQPSGHRAHGQWKWAAISATATTIRPGAAVRRRRTTGRAYCSSSISRTGVVIRRRFRHGRRVRSPRRMAWRPRRSSTSTVTPSPTTSTRATCAATCGSSISKRRPERLGRLLRHRCRSLALVRRQRRGGAAQPITSKPEVSRGPKGVGMMVLFGTGKFLEPVDKAPTQTQTFYGIHDKNTGDLTQDGNTGRGTQLLAQTITFRGQPHVWHAKRPDASHVCDPHDCIAPGLVPGPGEPRRADSQGIAGVQLGAAQWAHRVHHADPRFRSLRIRRTSWLMEIDALSGARLADPPFDMNNDGLFTTADSSGTASDGTVWSGARAGVNPRWASRRAPASCSTRAPARQAARSTSTSRAAAKVRRA